MVDSRLPRNYTACVQYDKRGEAILRKNPYSVGGSSLFGPYPLGTVILKEGLAYGQETYALYDPFELYDSWRERRDGPLPPHLVFANLPNEDAAAVAFLETYGPLTDLIQNKIRSQDVEHALGTPLGVAAREARKQFGKAAVYWQERFPGSALRPSLKPAHRTGRWCRVVLREFWKEQQEFRYLSGLWEMVRNHRPETELREYLPSARATPVAPRLNYYLRVGEWQASLDKIRAASAEQLNEIAQGFLGRRVSLRLAHTHPVLAFGADQSTSGEPIRHFWNCSDLLEALYMMLFLDISLERRILRCEGCGILFADAKGNVHYCSSRCEIRARVRRWWRKRGKGYRARQQRKTGRHKPTRKSTRKGA